MNAGTCYDMNNINYYKVKHGGAISRSHCEIKEITMMIYKYYCVYHSVIYITTTCSNGEDNIV